MKEYARIVKVEDEEAINIYGNRFIVYRYVDPIHWRRGSTYWFKTYEEAKAYADLFAD